MASFYQAFTAARTTEADSAALLTALRALDATAAVQHLVGPSYAVKKATAWTGPQITAAQNAIETAPVFDATAAEVDQKILTAVAAGVWECIPVPTMTKAQLRVRILAIRNTL